MQQKKPLLTIVMPVHNAEKNINQMLDSIATQAFSNYELLVIDGLSTDTTKDRLLLGQQQNFRIRLISEKDKGIYDAMNKGINLAKGEWLYFMGADDEFFNGAVLENIAKHFTIENDIVYGDSIWIPENRKEAGEWNFETFIKANINHQRIFYHKSLFEKFGNFKIKYKVAADHELNIRFFCNQQINKKYIPLVIANYYSGGFSAQKTDEVFWEDWDEIVLKNFRPYLPKKIIYGSLGIYIRYLIDKNEKYKAFRQLLKHFMKTRSPGFIKLMLNYYFNPKSLHAS